MKYGRDQNKDMKRPDNEQPDEEVDELTNLAGTFIVKLKILNIKKFFLTRNRL